MDISVFPNPTSGDVFIEFNNTDKLPMNIDVLNSSGQLIKVLLTPDNRKEVHSFTWSPKDEELPSGIYYIRIKSGDKTQLEKVMYENR